MPTILSDDPPAYKCDKCSDTGWIRYTRDGYVFARECECARAERARRRVERSGMKHLLERYTFKTYTAEEPWQKNVLAKALEYTDTLKSGSANDPKPWFFIGGNSGSGKTHICTAICDELISAGKRVMYMPWLQSARTLKASVTDAAEYEAMILPYLTCDVLYIDDLFKDKGIRGLDPTDADVRLLYQIVSARYNDDLPVIISCEWYLTSELLPIDEATFSRVLQKCVKRSGKNYNLSIDRQIQKNWRLNHLK